jgi:hypothetical protein
MTGGMKGGSNEVRTVLAYYLANTNKYDEKIASLAKSYGFDDSQIVILIILNNVDDIRVFCKNNKLSETQTRSIVSLKRYSALYNLNQNF